MTDRRSLLASLLAAGCLAAAAPALGQGYPSRAITIVVPYPPGGSADPLIRVIGERVSDRLGQPVIIDNRTGGAGNVGALAVRQAAPDGYTLFMAHMGTHAINPTLFPDLRFDPIKDFQPITTLMSFPSVLVVPSALPATSVAELVAHARSKPGGLSYASQGIGSGGHLLGEMLKARAGIPMTHVPYRGAAPAVTDLIAGRVDLLFASYISSGEFVRDGRLRILGLTAEKRSKILAAVPTMAEAGYPGVELELWYGVMAPAGTPAAIVAKLHDVFVEAARSPEVERLVVPQAADVITSTPEAFARLIAADIARLAPIIRASGARGE
jgi:tripartite-type tricarboxylate transporter receptor subunit TctC